MTAPNPAGVIYPKEPALLAGGSVAGVSGILGLLDAFALPVAPQWKLAIALGIAFLAPLVHGLLVRSKVFAPDTVAQMEAEWMALLRSVKAGQPQAVTAPDPPAAQ